ncbi:TBC1 domain family member 31 [Ceratitis capitata]|uniref:(Mediterranean fruit fly) hypothetical protein n=1 Tax=Ceratitis capitata TaxID=7213 RepID=A0A811VFN2_CERCA|nr:TBC1 domain family member 31 [Ceratitis capitata]XP_020717720.1 TBC1 domain family member 31 [Ceratitis capitata]CAD7014110.1 unnamed protein product [Ceratitis capitata]
MEKTTPNNSDIAINTLNHQNNVESIGAPAQAAQEAVDKIRDAIVEESIGDADLSAKAAGAAFKNISDDEEGNPQDFIEVHAAEPVRKYAFRFKKCDKGNILTVHHTVHTGDSYNRLCMVLCCFNKHSTNMVAITSNALIFVFDLVNKLYWRLPISINRPTAIAHWAQRENQYIIGNAYGELFLLDLERSEFILQNTVAEFKIIAISLPDRLTKHKELALVQSRNEVLIVDLATFLPKHRMEFDKEEISLKFACYLPQSHKLFMCFTNGSVHIWSSRTMKRNRVLHSIEMRDRRLKMQGAAGLTAEFVLRQDYNVVSEFGYLDCLLVHIDGMILAYCCHPDNGLVCLSTADGFLLLINTCTFELAYICRLKDFILRECVFLKQQNEVLICGVTGDPGQVVILNCLKKDIILRIQLEKARILNISKDSRFLTVFNETGEMNLWSTSQICSSLKSQEECMRSLQAVFQQNKSVLLVGPSLYRKRTIMAEEECLHEDVRKLLNRDRLLGILREFHWFPQKYRVIIWCALLQLPYNRSEYFQLLKMGTPTMVKQRAKQIQIRDGTLRNALIRAWSCLAHWCPVFAHSKFLPNLLFPFVKLLQRNALVTFEICVTLLMNHFQLWFELHPLEPNNYLGLCENILQSECAELCTFYAGMHVRPEHYVWSILSTGFSEVFNEADWLCLWDNIIAWPSYFPIFIAVAYNIEQSKAIMHLPDKPTILAFFHEQNPVDVSKVISKAFNLMQKCPQTLHPGRYMKEFQCIPKKVYPKFLNYPREWLAKHEEDLSAVQKEKQYIDAKIRQLELEEMKLKEHLENGLREEEHARQVEKMEKLYRSTLNREEERLACHRQLLNVYQKELRNRKAEVAVLVEESEQRQRALQMEKDLELLMQSIECERTRNDTDLRMVEEEIRNEELELLLHNRMNVPGTCSLRNKYYERFKRLHNERRSIREQINEISNSPKISKIALNAQNSNKKPHLDTIEERIEELQREFNDILNSK